MSEEIAVEPVVEPTGMTQSDVDRIVAERLGREKKKYEKKYEGVDLEAYGKWQQDQEASELARQKAAGDFDTAMKTMADTKDAEIKRLRGQVTTTAVDGELLRAASALQAVQPSQVSSLLRNNIRLSDEGKAEVLDDSGAIRYSDDGSPLTVSSLVNEFLTTNPHFVKATQGGAGSAGNVGGNTLKPKSVGEMSSAEYADHRKSVGRGRNTGGFIKPS
jgi:hypothetical protein